MKNLTPICPLFLLVLAMSLPCAVRAKVHDYETTRLKSTGGAGVGSILINESAILNPASIAFFSNSSFYVQRESFKYKNLRKDRPFSSPDSTKSKASGVIIADTKAHLRGAFSYQKQQEGFQRRRRITVTLASIITKKSSLGFLYRNTKDEVYRGLFRESVDRYHQLVVGTTHVVDEDFTLGIVIVDPLKEKRQDTRAIIGVQYIAKNILTFIADIGGNYSDDLLNTRLFRGALQLNIFTDFYFRFGLFEDRGLDEKGYGFGLSWVGPKLVFETAIKRTQDLGFKASDVKRDNLEMSETSFALSYFF